MAYRTLLFDVDDTLLDFKAAEEQALTRLLLSEQLELTGELKRQYQVINHGLWQAYERGEKSSQEVVEQRFGQFFGELGKTVDSIAMEARYRGFLNEGHQLLGNSLAVIQQLRPDFSLYIVTNGLAKTQYQRLQAAQLLPYFDGLFISEEVGYQKPQSGFFEHVFANIPALKKAETLIIGDSLTSDIQGGLSAGIDTVWLKPQTPQPPSAIQATYEISRLEELFTVLA